MRAPIVEVVLEKYHGLCIVPVGCACTIDRQTNLNGPIQSRSRRDDADETGGSTGKAASARSE